MQPLIPALLNNFYRNLIEAGADVNSFYVPSETVRDTVKRLIMNNECNIEGFKRELARRNENKENKTKTSVEEQNLQYLDKLLKEEKRAEKGSYREYLLNSRTVDELYNFLHNKYPTLCPLQYSTGSFAPYLNYGANDLTKLLELETKKLNYNKECLEYLINHGAKTSFEINLEKSLKIPRDLMKQYKEQLSSVKKSLEKQDEMTAEERERYLKEETLLQLNIDNQQKEIDKLMNVNQEKPPRQIPLYENYENDDLVELPLEILSSKSLVEINFDEFIMEFKYMVNNNRNRPVSVPKELGPEYLKLFQAVYVNDIKIVERMSRSLVLAVQDKCHMTPFIWACLRGHSELAVKILDIAVSQYTGMYKKDTNLAVIF
jgi:hypothetical protein